MGGDNSKENVTRVINKTVFNAFLKVGNNIFQTAAADQTLQINCCPTELVERILTKNCDSCFRNNSGDPTACIAVCSACSQINNQLDAVITLKADGNIDANLVNSVANELKTQASQNFQNQSDFISSESLGVLAGADGSVRNLSEITNDITNTINTEVLNEMKQAFQVNQSLFVGTDSQCSQAGTQYGNTLSASLEAVANSSISVQSYNEAVSKASTEISQTLKNESSTLGALNTLAKALTTGPILIVVIVVVIGLAAFFFLRKANPVSALSALRSKKTTNDPQASSSSPPSNAS